MRTVPKELDHNELVMKRIKGVKRLFIDTFIFISLVIGAQQTPPLGKDFLPRQPTPNYMAGGFGSFLSIKKNESP